MPDVRFSNQYPYTDFHELNLDWIIKEVKYWSEKVGKTIQSINLTGTVGLVDTYTITYSDGTTSTFDVTNGNGIASVAKTGTTGLVDTYTITFQDGSTSTFEVTNGAAAVDPTLTLSDYAADAKVTGDMIFGILNPADLEITNAGAGGVSGYAVIFPGRRYRFTNNASGIVNVNYINADGTYTLITNGLPSGGIWEFTPDRFYSGIRVYFGAAGTCKVESIDDGMFESLDRLVYNYSAILEKFTNTITATSAGSYMNSFCPITKGRFYTYTNNSTGAINLSIIKYDGTYEVVSSGIGPGNSYTFKSPSSGWGVRSYFAAVGNAVLTSIDDGVFDQVGPQLNLIIPDRDLTTVAMFESIAVIGDSYASGGIYISSPYNWGMNYDLSWPAVLQRLIGSSVNNYSKAGLSTRTWLTDNDRGLSKALSDDPSGLYLMCLGINDSGIPGYMGDISDINDNDYTLNPDTFYGNYGKIMAQLITHAPNGKFVFIVPPNALGAGYSTAIQNIAAHYSVPVLLPSGDPYFSTDFWADNMSTAHPVAMTYAGMAQAYIRQMSICIQDNATYFKDYHQSV